MESAGSIPDNSCTDRISCLIFTYKKPDEVCKLANKIKDYVDEIVIVDSSPKQYLELLKRKIPFARILSLPPIGLADLWHQISVNACSNEWIINIDDDEEPNNYLLKDLRYIIATSRSKVLRILRIDMKTGARERVPRIFHKSGIILTGAIHQSRVPKFGWEDLPEKYLLYHHTEKYRFEDMLQKAYKYSVIESYHLGFKMLYLISRKRRPYSEVVKKCPKFGRLGWLLLTTGYNVGLMIIKALKTRSLQDIALLLFYHVSVQANIFKDFSNKVKIWSKMYQVGGPIRFMGFNDIKEIDFQILVEEDGLKNFERYTKIRLKKIDNQDER